MALYTLSVDGIALVAATAKSIVEIATGANDRAKIVEWSLTFDGVTATAVPVKCEIGRFSAGVTTATTLAGGKEDAGEGTPGVTSKHSTSAEGAGAIDASAKILRLPPTSGMIYQSPLGRETILGLSAFWRMRLTAAAVVNVTFHVTWEE